MIDLSEKESEIEINLLRDLNVKVTPPTTATMHACRAAADSRLDRMRQAHDAAVAAGQINSDEQINFEDESTCEGLRLMFTIEELGVRHIKSWTGVLYDGKEIEPDEPRIRALLSKSPLGITFYNKLTIKQMERLHAKKGSGAVASGI